LLRCLRVIILHIIWSEIDVVQLIVYLPLIKARFPASLTLFFSVLMHVAAFELTPTDGLFDQWLTFEKSQGIKDPNLRSLGYESTSFLKNLGFIFFAYITYFILYVLLQCLLYLLRCKKGGLKRLRSFAHSSQSKLVYSQLLKLVM